MQERIHIVVAEPSAIIRNGVISILKHLSSLNIDVAEICDISQLINQLSRLQPDILIIDPSYLGVFSLTQVKNEAGCATTKTIALQNTLTDKSALQSYDDIISIYDNVETIKEKLQNLMQNKNDNLQELSTREKEIVVCIVKGMTNKQIAENLFLSTHTIITHRRNIANKLQIHSPAGLTIYAIVKNLVEINEIKSTIIPEE